MSRQDTYAPAAPLLIRADVPVPVCEAYVREHPQASAYHDPAWLGVIARSFGHDTQCLAAETADGLVGVLPLVFFNSRLFGRFAVSLPFVNYGGVVADDDRAARALLEAAIVETKKRGGTHLELRHHGRQLFSHLAVKRHKVAMTLRLEASSEAQWAALDKKLRNQVRKAEKSGLRAEHGGLELLDDFYRVFARNMRDLGTPVYSRRFFREVLTAFPDHARVFCVRLGSEVVAASLTYGRGRTIEVPWASAIREFNPLCANVYLYWQMLSFAVENRFGTVDFGRSTPGEGTFLFKKQWGAAPEELVWEYWTAAGRPLPDLNPANPKFDMAIRAWQRLPVSIATALGPLVVRHIP